MCGLTGFITTREAQDATALERRVMTMADTLVHRGPDDAGAWTDPDNGVALGFRRLAIVDTSPLGHQPMSSATSRYTVVFNGEIYNHRDLRADLDITFRGGSDTETLLAAVERWGIEETIRRIRGMYAIALWDRELRQLTLVRDRMGEKPLYYGWNGDTFLFGSELRALRAWPEFEQPLDMQAIDAYLRRGMIPAPMTIFTGIRKLRPGHVAQLDFGRQSRPDPAVRPYWSVSDTMHHGAGHPFAGSPEDAVDTFDTLMQDVIREQSIADVPLGAFLSGGVDSSLVVALMQAQSGQAVKTCSIGFDTPEFDEAPYARAVAHHLGTDHEDLYVSGQDALDLVPRLGDLWDEPFADSSQIPTFLVSQIARRRVTVALTGDGSDEVFGGYANYRRNLQMWPKVERVPRPLRTAIGRGLLAMPNRPIDAMLSLMGPALPDTEHGKPDSITVRRYAALLRDIQDREMWYQDGISTWGATGSLTTERHTYDNPFVRHLDDDRELDYLQLMCLRDMELQLPDDMLVKVDRAAMANSLETRAPFLDHRVVEFSSTVPSSYKVRDGAGKWVVKQALLRYVPRELIERPKRGFAIPVAEWLRGPLRPWAEDLLANAITEQDGLVRMDRVRDLWNGLLAGDRRANPARLWYVLQLEQWLRAARTPSAVVRQEEVLV
jgi:asparagine synthase (glutamine-hydrolysing)